ncbi:MAG: DUF86 domain-containing protein [Dehalococcoidia bacterium]|nr:DUF86 domain-containing protein [Dehalococcoidia bacterium]
MNPPLRPEVLRRRLQRLDEALQFLERSRRYTLEEFLADPERYGAAERFLQVAIEAADDCAAHIVAALALGPVETARDLPRLLAEHGFLEPELAQRWMRAIGFRNVLVHE